MKVCRNCDTELKNDNWYPSYRLKNDAICMDCVRKKIRLRYYKDDSTAKIHDIIEKYGSEDNRMLMVDLQNLRKIVILETHFEYRSLLKIMKEAIISNYYNAI